MARIIPWPTGITIIKDEAAMESAALERLCRLKSELDTLWRDYSKCATPQRMDEILALMASVMSDSIAEIQQMLRPPESMN